MKKRNIYLFNIAWLILMLCLQHCQCKKIDTVTPTIQCNSSNSVLVPKDMKDRFYFKVGTYWIYKNINTNDIDSMWVWTSAISTTSVDPKIYGTGFDKCYENFYLKVKNIASISNDKYYNSIALEINPIKGTSNNELFGIEDFLLEISPVVSYRIENRGGVYENQMGEIMRMFDSIVTKDSIIYKNILHLYYPTGTQTVDYLLDMYYAKNIGLVKFKRRTDNTEWELIRYHIIQ